MERSYRGPVGEYMMVDPGPFGWYTGEDHHNEPSGLSATGSGYGNWKYTVEWMRTRVESLTRDLPWIMRHHGADSIVVRGTSGTFIAGPLLLAIPDLKILMVRKPGEASHGAPIEGQYGHLYRRAVFVDDLIDSGATLAAVKQELLGRVQVVAAVLHGNRARCIDRPLEQTQGQTLRCGIPVYE